MREIILGITHFLVLLNAVYAQSPQCQPAIFKDIESGQIVHLDTTLLFTESGSTGGIWRSNGTISGTAKLTTAPAYSQFPDKPCIQNGFIYFYTSSPLQLWKTDGTEAGTALVKAFPNANAIRSLVATNSMVFFLVEGGNYVNKFWKTNGTEAGTMIVKDTDPTNSLSWDPFRLFATDDLVFFHAGTASTGIEIWKSDGTADGTNIIKEINPGPNDGTYHIINGSMAELNGKVYFYGGASSTTNEQGLWETDGTEAGTQFLQEVGSFSNAFTYGNAFYFTANDAQAINGNTQFGLELWKCNGTPSGTVMIKDIYPGTAGSIPGSFSIKALASNILFYADNGTSGYEPWISDGTEGGTQMLKDIYPGQSSSANGLYASDILDGFAYFMADNGVNGKELWGTDGTSAGTNLVADIIPGSDESIPLQFDVCNGNLYFSALAANAFDNSIWTCGNNLGVKPSTDNQVAVYPNPGNGQFQIINLPLNSTFEVISTLGIVVASEKTTNSEYPLNLRHCSSGLYTLMVRYANGSIGSQKILITN